MEQKFVIGSDRKRNAFSQKWSAADFHSPLLSSEMLDLVFIFNAVGERLYFVDATTATAFICRS